MNVTSAASLRSRPRGRWLLVSGVALWLAGCATTPSRPPSPAQTSRLHQERGIMERLMGDVAKAEAEFRQAMALDPNNPDSYFQLGLILGQTPDRRKEAVELLQRAAALDPKNPQRWSGLSAACGEAGDVDGEIAAATRALELKPDTASLLFSRGLAQDLKRNRPAALADFLAASRLEPGNAKFIYWAGRVREIQLDFAGALADYNRVLQLKPDHADAYIRRAHVFYAKQKPADALADLSRGLILDPENAEAWNLRGNAHLALYQVPEAVVAYSRAVELKPGEAYYWLACGQTRFMTGDYDGAVDDFDHVVALEPGHRAIYYARGRARLYQGDRAGALADLTTAIDRNQADVTCFRLRGILRDGAGDFAGAYDDFGLAVLYAMEERRYEHFWRLLLQQRTGGPVDTQMVAGVAATATDPWVKAVAEFLTGVREEKDLLALAEAGVGGVRDERRCEAFYYAGMGRLLHQDGPGAQEFFRKCVGTGMTRFHEFMLATGELARPAPPAGAN